MSSENKTPNIGLNQWQGNEYIKRNDFVNDNLIIDSKIKDLQDEKVDKVSGKELSTNDYTNEEKNKLSSLEKEIKAPPYTPTIHNCSNIFSAGEGYANDGSVLDYSESVANGQVSVGLKGQTLVNSIKNGDFSDGANNWRGVYGTIVLNDGNLRVTGSGDNYFFVAQQGEVIDTNSMVALYARVRVLNNNANVIFFQINDGLGNRQFGKINNPEVNKWYEIFGFFSSRNGATISKTAIGLYVLYDDASTANGKSLEIDGNAGVFAINMTQLGIEDYTEEQMLSLVRNGYFEGAKSTVLAQRIKATGKNLFDGEWESGTIDVNTGEELGGNNIRFKNFIKISPNEIVTMSKKITNNIKIRFYDYNKDYIGTGGYIGVSGLKYTYNVPLNAYYIKFTIDSINDLDTEFQLEEGTTATPYEPYKEDKTYISCTDDDGNIEELRSLPNGVKDEVKDGKLYKRTKEVILTEDNITRYITTNTNVDIVTIRKKDDYIGFNNILSDNNILCNGYITNRNINPHNYDSIEHICKISPNVNNLEHFIFVIKGQYTNLTEAKTSLAGTTLIYQLAEPKIIPIKGITPLQIWKNGTISIEPYLRKSIKYTSGKLTFPIALSSIDKIVDINSNEINLNNILLASDGTYATITGASDNDIFIVYASIKPGLSTVPTTVMSFPMNTKAQIESNCKGVQQLGNNVITLQDTMAMFIVKNA